MNKEEREEKRKREEEEEEDTTAERGRATRCIGVALSRPKTKKLDLLSRENFPRVETPPVSYFKHFGKVQPVWTKSGFDLNRRTGAGRRSLLGV